MRDPRPSVALIDDHQLVRASLAAMLEAEGFAVALPPLGSLDALHRAMVATPPDVALLDLDLGDAGSGLELVAPLTCAGAAVVVVSGTDDEGLVGHCIELGACGWVSKVEDAQGLLGAVRAAVAGEPLLAHGERDRLLRAWREQRQAHDARLAPFALLTRREQEVLESLTEGLPAARIASSSYVSTATVRTQIRAILTKLGVNSRLEAVAAAARSGWVPPSKR